MRSSIREELRGGCQTAEGVKSSEHPQNQQPIVGSTIMTLPNTKSVSYDTCENSYAISSLPLSASQLLERLASTSRPDSEWAFELIKRGPIEGANGGCHGWLYQAARALYLYRHRHGFGEQEMFTLLRAKADGYGRRVPDNEINDALESAIRHAGNPNSKQQTRQTCWPEPDFERADAIVKVGFGLKDLQEPSPVNLARSPTSSAQVVSCLFTHLPGTNDPLICASPFSNTRRMDAGELITKPLSKWMSEEEFSGWWRQEKLRQQSFIVPSPMTKILSAKDGGEYSPRCLNNTGPREYLVIECDISKFGRDGKTPSPWKSWVEKWEEHGLSVADACAAILWHLNQYEPLVLAVHSGGKSIHGWFPCRGVAEEKLKRFMEYAVMIGADHATWNRCQLVRMPGGTRDFRKRQQVLFYDPATIKSSMEVAA